LKKKIGGKFKAWAVIFNYCGMQGNSNFWREMRKSKRKGLYFSGKCKKDQPCACIENQCVDPWFLASPWRKQFPDKNCRSPEVSK
jgi:hypothetical protein